MLKVKSNNREVRFDATLAQATALQEIITRTQRLNLLVGINLGFVTNTMFVLAYVFLAP